MAIQMVTMKLLTVEHVALKQVAIELVVRTCSDTTCYLIACSHMEHVAIEPVVI